MGIKKTKDIPFNKDKAIKLLREKYGDRKQYRNLNTLSFTPPIEFFWIEKRNHTPKSTKTIFEIAELAGLYCPFDTDSPLQIELLSKANDNTWKNMPYGSYSTEIQDPIRILQMLAFSANEWQAHEIMCFEYNKYRSPKQLEQIQAIQDISFKFQQKRLKH